MSWKRRGYTPPETTFIYALCDPSGEVRYVGKTDTPHKRLVAHIGRARHNMNRWKAWCYTPTRKDSWIMHLLDEGKEPELVILEECDFEVWFKREEYWRDYYLDRGCRLTNRKRNGGRGRLNDEYYEITREEEQRRYQEGKQRWTWDYWKEFIDSTRLSW